MNNNNLVCKGKKEKNELYGSKKLCKVKHENVMEMNKNLTVV